MSSIGRFAAIAAATVLNISMAKAYSVKSLPQAANGCIPKITLEQARNAISRFNFRTKSATNEEVRTLGTALVWIEALNGGKPLARANAINRSVYTFRFQSGSGSSYQSSNEIVITRNGARQNGERVAQLVHELGHFLGNNGAYADYRRAVNGKMCEVSSYALSKPNEQFAEVFATFVTFPSRMKSNSSTACRQAYVYFEKELFANGTLAQRCASRALRPDVDYKAK